MTMHYKVWLEIEEVDETRDHYQTVDTPGAELVDFATYEEAWSYAEAATNLLNSPLELPRRHGMTNLSMILQLIHGRTSPDAELKQWGFDAPPIHGVSFFRGTYLTTFTVGFVSETALAAASEQTGWPVFDVLALEVTLHDGLIRCRDAYYGDFEVYIPPVIA